LNIDQQDKEKMDVDKTVLDYYGHAEDDKKSNHAIIISASLNSNAPIQLEIGCSTHQENPAYVHGTSTPPLQLVSHTGDAEYPISARIDASHSDAEETNEMCDGGGQSNPIPLSLLHPQQPSSSTTTNKDGSTTSTSSADSSSGNHRTLHHGCCCLLIKEHMHQFLEMMFSQFMRNHTCSPGMYHTETNSRAENTAHTFSTTTSHSSSSPSSMVPPQFPPV